MPHRAKSTDTEAPRINTLEYRIPTERLEIDWDKIEREWQRKALYRAMGYMALIVMAASCFSYIIASL